MPEIIASIVKSIEVIMGKYGFWNISILITLWLLIWQFSNILNSFVNLIEILK